MWTNNSIDDLVIGVMRHGPSVLEHSISNDPNLLQYLDTLDNERLNYPIPKTIIDKDNWLIPHEYKNMDIEEFLVSKCPKENYDRLIKELDLYHKNNMIPVLKTIKYIVDTLRKNNIVWGVGRGSSVASYVLFLLGVHKIDSVKYNLPIDEFFKGETNG
jgi:DNA polymerase III alpha subunit